MAGWGKQLPAASADDLTFGARHGDCPLLGPSRSFRWVAGMSGICAIADLGVLNYPQI